MKAKLKFSQCIAFLKAQRTKYYSCKAFGKNFFNVYSCNFTCNFQCDILLLMDVNEWISNKYSECALPRLNIRYWCTRSHPSKGDNRIRNHSECCDQASILTGKGPRSCVSTTGAGISGERPAGNSDE